MTRTYENAEELFRFASTRAPGRAQQPAGLLQLADDSEVPAWLAVAADTDFAQELIALEARWQGLTGRDAQTVNESVRLGSEGSKLSADNKFPVVKGKRSLAEADALLKSLWKYYLQGVGSGAAQSQQLQRVQQLMGQAALLQALAAGEKGVAVQARMQAALNPVVKLPAAFEAHLRLRHTDTGRSVVKVADTGPTRAQLETRLALLQSLERRLAAALAHPQVFESPLPFSAPVPPRADPAAPRTYFFQPAADPAQLFRVANEALLLEIEEALIVIEGRTPWQVLDALRREIAVVAQQIAALPATTPPPEIPAGSTFGIRPVGVADLKVVKQVLIGYAKGELADIQSIPKGATVERQHSRLQRADEGRSDYSQRDSERQRETDVWEGSDMGRYLSANARANQDENGSINLSGTYGDIQYNASSFVGANRGRDETRAEDARRSRQLVDRALQLTREYVGQSRWRSLTAETQDSTLYRQKAKCRAMVAQYHWVDKVYEAQVFNYGARAVYEIMVPTPAALFTQLLAQQPGATPFAGVAPVRPTLLATELTDSNWAQYAERFGVALSPPPPVSVVEYAQVTSRLDIPGHPLTRGGSFNRAAVPAQGYEASIAGVSMSWIGVAGESGITASVGALLFSSSIEPDQPIPAQAMAGETADVTYSVSTWGTVDQYTVNFYIVWTRSQRAFEQWQVESYQAIIAAYEQKLAAYLEKSTAPLTEVQMRTIERNELKRAVLEVIRRGTGQATQAPTTVINGLPAIDVARLEAAAREVRFFEYAFEWDQMTYRFYPYFWAGQESWNAARFTQQGDSVFTAFLNAGFASVILPVRKGFENAVAVYLQTGVVLDLAVVPADDELADMNCEVGQINEACAEGVPEGEPWTYRVPTTISVLDDDSGCELPAIES